MATATKTADAFELRRTERNLGLRLSEPDESRGPGEYHTKRATLPQFIKKGDDEDMDDDSDSQVKRAKRAKLRQAIAKLQAKLKALDDDDAEMDDDDLDDDDDAAAARADDDDAQAREDSAEPEDELWRTDPNPKFAPTSRQKDQSNPRKYTNDHGILRPLVGRGLVESARRIASERGLNWSDLKVREKAITLAAKEQQS